VHTDDIASGSPQSLDGFPFQGRIDQHAHAVPASSASGPSRISRPRSTMIRIEQH
jgi:hypothetical protein